jgi:hypothetical protein
MLLFLDQRLRSYCKIHDRAPPLRVRVLYRK